MTTKLGAKNSGKSEGQISVQKLPDDVLEDAGFAAKDQAWAAVAGFFDDLQEREEITYSDLAKLIGRPKSQVHRWLNSSSNITLKSLGLLAAGMKADVRIALVPEQVPVRGANYCHPADAAATSIKFFSSNEPILAGYNDGTRKRVRHTKIRTTSRITEGV